jgi:glycosyltransferase involved in cell wall biosynthesis
MKIIFGIDYISRKNTGVSTLVENLSVQLNKRGFNSFIASIEDKFSQVDIDKFKSAENLLINKKHKPFSVFRSYFKFYLNADADIAHLHSIWSISAVAIYCWSIIKNKPYIISANGMLSGWALSQSRLKKKFFLNLIFKRIIRRADSIIVNSKADKEYLEQNGWHSNFYVIPNGVKIPVREETNLVPKIEKTLLFLSRIHVKKGIDILLDAWSELHEQTKMDNWTLKVVGFLDEEQNDYEKYILNKIAIFPTLSNVRTSEGKFGDEMWDEFFLSDAFVLPTFSEGSAMVVLNGWTAGKICVTTIGSNLEYGLDEKCTILVEPNIESLKVGILRLLSMDDDNLQAYGKVGKEVVLRNYTWEKIVDQHVEIYKKTIKR